MSPPGAQWEARAVWPGVRHGLVAFLVLGSLSIPSFGQVGAQGLQLPNTPTLSKPEPQGVGRPNATGWTLQVELGEALYYGIRSFNKAPQVAGASLPAHDSACVRCHGALGQGGSEGSITAPGLQAIRSADSLIRAIGEGIGSKGQALSSGMPRYTLSPLEREAMLAFLPWLGRDDAPVRGVSADEIRLGLVLDGIESQASREQIRAGVASVLQLVNEHGGIHGRQLRHQVLPAAAVAGTVADLDVFALLASAPAPALREQLAALRLPNVASLALEREDVSARSWTIPLLPSLRQQSRHAMRLIDASSRRCQPVLYDPLGWISDAELTPADPTATGRQRDSSETFKRLSRVDELRPGTAICLVALAPADVVDRQLDAIDQHGVRVTLLVELAWLRTRALERAGLDHRLILPTPMALADRASGEGRSIWFVIGEAAANAGVEALAASGRALQPEHLLARFRSLTGFEPVAGAPLQLGKGQTHGWLPQAWPIDRDSSQSVTALIRSGATP